MNHSKHKIYRCGLACLLVLLFLSQNMVAQEDDLPVEEVEVIKNFEARLAEANKLNIHPVFPPLDSTMESFEYSLGSYEPALSYIQPDIRPLAMAREQRMQAYDGYLKGGYGFPNQSLFKGGYHSQGTDGQVLDIEARHHAARDRDIEHKRFMENRLNAEFDLPLQDNLTLKSRAAYRLDRYYYYGYDHSDTTLAFSDEEAEKQFNEFDAGIGIQNEEFLRGYINYKAQLDFYQLKDDLATRENGLALDLMGEKHLSKRHPLRIRIELDYTNLKDTLQRKLNNFHLFPDFTYHGTGYRLKAGLRVSSSDDEFYLFPLAEIKAEIAGERLIGYLGTKGNLYKNSYRQLTEINPYITERIDSLTNSSHYTFYGGISGRVRSLTYDVSGAYKNIRDLALFLPQSNDPRKFTTRFDDVDIIRISARVEYEMNESFLLQLTANKNFYSPEKADKAWHLPRFKLDLHTTYRMLENKLRLQGTIHWRNGIYTRNADGDTEKLKGLFDISLAADYYFTHSFGAFVHLNNLTGNKWERWDRYPTFGVNAVVGLQYRF